MILQSRLRSVAVVVASLAGAMGFYSPVWAQTASPAGSSSSSATAATDSNQQIEEIIITGTNIRGVQQTGSNTIDISQQDIQEQGATSTVDVLRDLPQVTNIGADPSRNSPGAAQRAIANTVGGTAINLRGLGIEATLDLVDGYRVPQGGGEGRYFDPTSLPLIALQRLDVVPDGASAIYGSDAITGVVNIIPVTRYDGIEGSVREGWAAGMRKAVDSAIGGHSWGSGGFVVAFEHSSQTALLAADRYGQYPNSAADGATSGNSFPANLSNNPGPPPYNFVPGSTQHFVDSSNTGVLNVANVRSSFGSAPGVSGVWTGADALPEESRNSVYVHADQAFSDALSGYMMGFFTQRDYVRLNTADTTTGLTIPGLSSGPNGNYYNQTAAAVAGSYNFLNSLGNPVDSGHERIWQLRGGFKANLPGDWTANLMGSYGQVDDYNHTQGINNQALGAAASCNNPNVGAFEFPEQSVTTCNNPATALNIFSNLKAGTPGFGYPSTATYQSVLSSINGSSYVHPVQNLTNVDLKTDGSLFNLPGGEVKAAVGLDYQHVYRTSVNGNNIDGPSVSDQVEVHYPNFSRQVESAFAELYIPIVGGGNSMPGIKSLLFDVAGRYDHYRDINQGFTDPAAPIAGSRLNYGTGNPKFGLVWQPLDGVSVRASYGTSFRAPVPGDYSYGAPTLGIPFTVSPAVASLLGLPATCATKPGSCYQIFNQGGTSDVKPERAKTYSFGADFAPPQVPGLTLALTYYHINYDDQIVVPGTGPWQSNPAYAQSLVNAGLLVPNPALGSFGAYNPSTVRGMLSYGNGNASNPANQYANYTGLPGYLFANGILPVGVLVNELNSNAGETSTQGIDYALHYQVHTAAGTFLFGDSGTFVFTYKQALAAGTPLVSYLNQINNPMHYQSRGQIGWSRSGFVANAFVNYVNAYQNPGVGKISSLTTLDLALAYSVQSTNRWLGNTRFELDATNVFNTMPPGTVNIANEMAYDPQEASAIGRLVSVQLSKRL